VHRYAGFLLVVSISAFGEPPPYTAYRTMPAYPRAAAVAHIKGHVTARITVSEKGVPTETVVPVSTWRLVPICGRAFESPFTIQQAFEFSANRANAQTDVHLIRPLEVNRPKGTLVEEDGEIVLKVPDPCKQGAQK